MNISPKKNQIIFVIDYETLDTHIYSGEGRELDVDGQIYHTDDKKAIWVEVRIEPFRVEKK